MTAAKLTFSQRASEGSRLFAVVQRFILIVALLFAIDGAWAAYRALVQVRALELRVLSPELRAGLPVVVQVVTSGRTVVDVRLELAQGEHVEMLATLRVAASHDASLDPRKRQGAMTPAFTAAFLGHFEPGPAVLRATAVGRPQWMRTPPPTVREMAVIVAQH
jgi:hypothetical protein